MGLLEVTRIVAIVGFGLGVLGILLRLKEILSRPYKRDLARPAKSPWSGVLYAFTLGMAPWEKESGRKHWVAYLRGVGFHIGIFAAFAVLFASPWLVRLPQWLKIAGMIVTGIGGLAGFGGVAMRWLDRNERSLSVPDDYFSVFLASLFVVLAFVSLLAESWLPAFYLVAAVMLVYIPFSKIRHCVYFFYSRFYFGQFVGSRGVAGQH